MFSLKLHFERVHDARNLYIAVKIEAHCLYKMYINYKQISIIHKINISIPRQKHTSKIWRFSIPRTDYNTIVTQWTYIIYQ